MTLALLFASAPVAGGTVDLAGSTAATGATTGNVKVSVSLAGNIAGVSVLAAETSVTHVLAAAPAGAGATTGALTVPKILDGQVAAQSVMTGLVTFTVPVAGLVEAVGDMTGALFFGISGQIIASAVMTGDMGVRWPVAGHGDGRAAFNPLLPSSSLYPSSETYPGENNVLMTLAWALGGTVAAQSTIKGGATALDGTVTGQAAIGFPHLPSLTLYPASSLYPGVVGGELLIGTAQLVAGTAHAVLVLTGGIVVGGSVTSSPVDIEIVFSQPVLITVTVDPYVEAAVSNVASVLIGVG